jgi:hypothetical protein
MNRGIVNQLAIRPLPVPKEVEPHLEADLEEKKTIVELIVPEEEEEDDEASERRFKVFIRLFRKNLLDFWIIRI